MYQKLRKVVVVPVFMERQDEHVPGYITIDSQNMEKKHVQQSGYRNRGQIPKISELEGQEKEGHL